MEAVVNATATTAANSYNRTEVDAKDAKVKTALDASLKGLDASLSAEIEKLYTKEEVRAEIGKLYTKAEVDHAVTIAIEAKLSELHKPASGGSDSTEPPEGTGASIAVDGATSNLAVHAGAGQAVAGLLCFTLSTNSSWRCIALQRRVLVFVSINRYLITYVCAGGVVPSYALVAYLA